MAFIGYHASHELFPPSLLLHLVHQAAQAGFTAAMCSDHFHPWTAEQGESGFAWSWLGAALQATTVPFGVVCAPGQRYHPAVIAQAAATLEEMFPGRFWLAVGSGENLNEHITGAPWPPKPERNARLRECVDVMRALWKGETVNHAGRVVVRDARIYTRPAAPPPVFGAALSAETAHWVGGWADGLITVGAEPDELQRRIDAFRQGGGGGKPVYLQDAVSYAPDEEQALRAAFHRWRVGVLGADQLADLPTPWAFDEATRSARPEDLRGRIRASADLGRHRAWLEQDLQAGVDGIYVYSVGPQPERFIEDFGAHVLPALGACRS